MDAVAGADGTRVEPNDRARFAFLAGLIATLAVPVAVGWGVWTYHKNGTPQLMESYVAVPVAAVLGTLAVILGRGGMRLAWLTLGRVGGGRMARAGWMLGVAGLYFATMGVLALAFYGILLLLR